MKIILYQTKLNQWRDETIATTTTTIFNHIIRIYSLFAKTKLALRSPHYIQIQHLQQ